MVLNVHRRREGGKGRGEVGMEWGGGGGWRLYTFI